MKYKTISYQQELENFWNARPDSDAHRDDKPNYIKDINPSDYKDQIVLDYGCGGGHLGVQLCDYVKHYIGVDCSRVSLISAMNRLRQYDNYTLLRVGELIDYKRRVKIDTFFCFYVIQHFPNFPYLERFLNRLKKLQPDQIVLNLRYNQVNTYVPYNFYHMVQTNVHEINKVLGYNIVKSEMKSVYIQQATLRRRK